ncbi:hypothetical protein MTO96_011336 [Rhipicephalus appendiculatus]
MQHDLDLQGILKQARLLEEVEHNISVMEQEHQQGLVQITYSLEETANRLDPRVAYPDLFSGVGCLRDLRVHLHVGTPLFNQ